MRKRWPSEPLPSFDEWLSFAQSEALSTVHKYRTWRWGDVSIATASLNNAPAVVGLLRQLGYQHRVGFPHEDDRLQNVIDRVLKEQTSMADEWTSLKGGLDWDGNPVVHFFFKSHVDAILFKLLWD